ncbi:MAG: hypothetical protein U0271_34770 [Polyangiaceae bacterium]
MLFTISRSSLAVLLGIWIVGCSVDTDYPTSGGAGGAATGTGAGGDRSTSHGSGGAPAGGSDAGGFGGAGASASSSGGASSGGFGGALGGFGGAGGAGGGAPVDLDQDGLADVDEATWAEAYRPFLSLHPDDGCDLGGIVYRVHPHPDDPTKLHIVYDHLFEEDCGFGGHVGDNEAFGVTVDPTLPAPEGIVSIVAIGHQGTLCEQVSRCGACGGLDACETATVNGVTLPIVYSSKDKHASYVNGCGALNCFDSCALSSKSDHPPMVNAGEPDAPLVSNLSTQGFINAQSGWTQMELFDIDPWDANVDFGGAGNIAGDLVDSAFVPCAN